ncbi:unnamed protein product [Rotaria sp. Silwood2]|nr:unnamed protein product [Rotaria sp. Silwood2]CAF2700737.1 unnamed protein product [Rotaria sp. Silwood2]CAF3899952.1 unnamed protein product [Rotaria sp. Silwood2]
MNSKEISRLTTTCICISFFFLLFRCASSQPLSTSLLKSNNNNNNDDDIIADATRMRPLPYSNSDEFNFEDDDYEVWSQFFDKALDLYNEHYQNNRPSISSPVRRANFWKRANFWRKRANFW